MKNTAQLFAIVLALLTWMSPAFADDGAAKGRKSLGPRLIIERAVQSRKAVGPQLVIERAVQSRKAVGPRLVIERAVRARKAVGATTKQVASRKAKPEKSGPKTDLNASFNVSRVLVEDFRSAMRVN